MKTYNYAYRARSDEKLYLACRHPYMIRVNSGLRQDFRSFVPSVQSLGGCFDYYFTSEQLEEFDLDLL